MRRRLIQLGLLGAVITVALLLLARGGGEAAWTGPAALNTNAASD